MSENKGALVLSRIFNVIFFMVFSWLLLEIVFRRYGDELGNTQYYSDYEQRLQIVLIGAVFTALLLCINYLIGKKRAAALRLSERREDKKDLNALPFIFAAVGVILVLQLISVYLLQCDPISDSNRMHQYACSYALNGNFDAIQYDYYVRHNYYMLCYPHNFPPMFFESFIYSLWYKLTGEVTRTPIFIVNVLCLNASILFTALLARKTYGDRKALLVLGVSALFLPYYTFTAYVYTDVFSIPFAIGAVLIFVCAMGAEKRPARIALYVTSIFVAYIGYLLKGSVIIVIVALLGYAFLKLRLRSFICVALIFAVCFVGLSSAYSAAFKAADIVTEEQLYEREMPKTHWIQMGLRGYGCYNQIDYDYTFSFIGKNEKQEANIEAIKETLEEMDIGDLAEHFMLKAMWTWGDGNYNVSGYISKYYDRTWLHEYVMQDGEFFSDFYGLSCGYQLFLILMMALSGLKGCLRPRCDLTLLFRISVFGIFLFLLIWETRSRYLFNFTPFFMLLAVDGADCGLGILREIKSVMRPLKAA